MSQSETIIIELAWNTFSFTVFLNTRTIIIYTLAYKNLNKGERISNLFSSNKFRFFLVEWITDGFTQIHGGHTNKTHIIIEQHI
jgi:hypothetical protein